MTIALNSPSSGEPRFFFGWIVVVGAFLLTALTCGAFYSFGIFFLPVVTEFAWSRSMGSGVVFVMAFTYAVTIPFVGMAADRLGFRLVTVVTAGIMGLGYFLGRYVESVWQMYLFVGFLPGLGAGSSLALPLAMVSRWFIRRQGLAIGLAASGIGVGGAIMPLIIAHAIVDLGWRMTFSYLGLFIWCTCIPVALVVMRKPDLDAIEQFEGKPSAGEEKSEDEDEKGYLFSQAIVSPYFWLLFLIFMSSSICVGMTITHVSPYAQDNGLSAIVAAGLLSVMGFCSIIGRILSGTVSDKTGAKPVLLVGLSVQGLMMFWLLNAETPLMFYTFAVLFSIAYAGNIVLIPRLTSSIFGGRSIGAIFSGISVADGMGFALGPMLAGFIFDISGGYSISFLCAAAGSLLAILMLSRLKEGPIYKR